MSDASDEPQNALHSVVKCCEGLSNAGVKSLNVQDVQTAFIKCNLSRVAEVSHDLRPRLESHIQAMVQAGIGWFFPWNSNCHSGDLWNAESTLQVSIWCVAFGHWIMWYLGCLGFQPTILKNIQLAPAKLRHIGRQFDIQQSQSKRRWVKNMAKEMLVWKESHAISHVSSNATVEWTLEDQDDSHGCGNLHTEPKLRRLHSTSPFLVPSNWAHPGALWVGWLRAISRAMQHQHHWSPPLNASRMLTTS